MSQVAAQKPPRGDDPYHPPRKDSKWSQALQLVGQVLPVLPAQKSSRRAWQHRMSLRHRLYLRGTHAISECHAALPAATARECR